MSSIPFATLLAETLDVVDSEREIAVERPAEVVAAVTRLADAAYPQRLCFGLGGGERSPERARAALKSARRGGIWLVADGFGPDDEVLTALFDLIGAVRSRWKGRQARYSAAARGRLQKDVAEEMGVSRSVISESLKSARHESVLRAEAAAARLLERLARERG